MNFPKLLSDFKSRYKIATYELHKTSSALPYLLGSVLLLMMILTYLFRKHQKVNSLFRKHVFMVALSYDVRSAIRSI